VTRRKQAHAVEERQVAQEILKGEVLDERLGRDPARDAGA
jgi:hypothetical protein